MTQENEICENEIYTSSQAEYGSSYYTRAERYYTQRAAAVHEPTPVQSDWTPKELSIFVPMAASGKHALGARSRSFHNQWHGYASLFERIEGWHQDLGIKHFVLHLPFGKQSQWPMDFDGPVKVRELIEDGTLPESTLTTPELFAWELGFLMRRNPEMKAAIYYGSLVKTQTLVELEQTDIAAYYDRVAESLEPISDVVKIFGIDKERIQPVFDHVGGGLDSYLGDNQWQWNPYMPEGSVSHRTLQGVEAHGWNPAIEPHTPVADEYKHLHRYPVYVIEDHWVRASTKQETKPLIPHVTSLFVNNSHPDSRWNAAIKDPNVDRISTGYHLIPKLKSMQQAYADSIGGGDGNGN